jgi:hypothetical protein
MDVRARRGAPERPHHVPIGPALLEAWATIHRQVYRLDREIRPAVRRDHACRLLMTAPSVGCMSAMSLLSRIRVSSNNASYKGARSVNSARASSASSQAQALLAQSGPWPALHAYRFTKFLSGGHFRATEEPSSGAVVRRRPQPWHLLVPAQLRPALRAIGQLQLHKRCKIMWKKPVNNL